MLVTERRPSRRTTDFRDTLNRLMVNHQCFTWKQLRERLTGVGYPVGQSQLSQYINKSRNIQEMEEFFEAVSEALDLGYEEEQDLSHAFTYSPRKRDGNTKATPEHWDKAQDFEGEVRDEVEDEGKILVEMRIREFDVGPDTYGYYFIDYELDIAALAVNPGAPEPAKQAAIIQGHGHTFKRPPKGNRQFIWDDREVEDLDPNAIHSIRSVIDDLQPLWVAEVKDACRIANHPRVIADWCDMSLATVVAIIDNLKARGEIPKSVGHSDVA